MHENLVDNYAKVWLRSFSLVVASQFIMLVNLKCSRHDICLQQGYHFLLMDHHNNKPGYLMKVQYLRSLLFDLFETLQAIRTWQRNFASFQILLPWQPKSKLLSIIEKQKIYCLSKSNVQSVI